MTQTKFEKTALEHALEVYEVEYMDYLKTTSQDQSEETAMSFIQVYESQLN